MILKTKTSIVWKLRWFANALSAFPPSGRRWGQRRISHASCQQILSKTMSLPVDFTDLAAGFVFLPEYQFLFSYFQVSTGRRERIVFSKQILHLGGLAQFFFSLLLYFFLFYCSQKLIYGNSRNKSKTVSYCQRLLLLICYVPQSLARNSFEYPRGVSRGFWSGTSQDRPERHCATMDQGLLFCCCRE